MFQVIRQEELPTLDTWLNCTSDLCPVEVNEEGRIEDAGCHTIEVGVLSFLSSPEHKVLRLSYCDRSLSVVVRRASCVNFFT